MGHSAPTEASVLDVTRLCNDNGATANYFARLRGRLGRGDMRRAKKIPLRLPTQRD